MSCLFYASVNNSSATLFELMPLVAEFELEMTWFSTCLYSHERKGKNNKCCKSISWGSTSQLQRIYCTCTFPFTLKKKYLWSYFLVYWMPLKPRNILYNDCTTIYVCLSDFFLITSNKKLFNSYRTLISSWGYRMIAVLSCEREKERKKKDNLLWTHAHALHVPTVWINVNKCFFIYIRIEVWLFWIRIA